MLDGHAELLDARDPRRSVLVVSLFVDGDVHHAHLIVEDGIPAADHRASARVDDHGLTVPLVVTWMKNVTF